VWSWRERGLVGRLLVVALVAGLVAGCGGSGSPTADTLDDDGPAGSAAAGGGGPLGSDPAGGGGGGGGGAPDEGLAWVPFGPSDPTNPTPSWPMYSDLAQGDCLALQAYLGTSDASNVGQLGRAMVAVCLAAVDGREDQWEVAATAVADGSGSLDNDCLEPIVRALLRAALDWHQDHPGRKPRVQLQTVAGDGTTKCASGPGPTDSTAPTDSTEPTDPTEPTASTDPTVTGSAPETTG
jgi:hypothetical protein